MNINGKNGLACITPLSNFKDKIQKYADVAVAVGLDFKAGQRLFLNAPIEARDLALAITRSAYKAGAEDVYVNWVDPEVDKIRLQNGNDNALTAYPQWVVDGLIDHTDAGHARINISCVDPDFLANEDSDKVRMMQRSRAQKLAPVSDRVVKNVANWLIVMSPHPAISEKLFPELSTEDARAKHWETIFKMCRIEGDNPVQDWKDHIANLETRSNYLNSKKFHALHYKSPVTDLTIGLPDNHVWETARLSMKNGTKPVVNIPTEEVFTLAHRERIDGVVRSTKPLAYNGKIIDNFRV